MVMEEGGEVCGNGGKVGRCVVMGGRWGGVL